MSTNENAAPAPSCFCPSDCSCRNPFRSTVCGCACGIGASQLSALTGGAR